MKKFLGLGLIGISMLISGCTASQSEIEGGKSNSMGNIYIEVTDKGVKRYSDSDKYLVYTKSGTYEITDSILNMQFNSSDIYGFIETGKCYNVGLDNFSFRLSLFSMYENITSAKEVECDL